MREVSSKQDAASYLMTMAHIQDINYESAILSALSLTHTTLWRALDQLPFDAANGGKAPTPAELSVNRHSLSWLPQGPGSLRLTSWWWRSEFHHSRV